ncbi:MAG: class I SAM-dependent methyltransferase [Acidobacteria bacterium]|nr:class I SAM-dependent methyltransferase [Acidobacteriota bacterium]
MGPDADPSSRAARANALYSRSESLSSGTASLGARTMASADPSASGETIATRPFAPRNGRTYLNDPSIVYPLPADLAELHRQSLRTLLLIQVFGAPACSPALAARPPTRILEIGCGSGFWSMMCHRYFRGLGHGNIAFTGLDIAPLAPGAGAANGGSGTPRDVAKPDPEMNWRFVRHDIRQTPFPFSDGEFDLVMVKDMGLAVTHSGQQRLMDEYLRVLKKGGHLEIWESDHTIRMLRPHVAGASPGTATAGAPEQEEDEHRAAAALGAYVMTSNTPLSPPLNNYLVEYNSWVSRALELRDVSAVPCTLIGPLLLQESDALTDVRSRRVAIPLSEVRWEKEGVGGVVTKDGKSYIDTRGRGSKGEGGGRKALSPAQAALRRTALETVVQGIQGMEPILREVSGKRVDEWEGWISKMAADLMGEAGTSWGECLEVGAWWAQKK